MIKSCKSKNQGSALNYYFYSLKPFICFPLINTLFQEVFQGSTQSHLRKDGGSLRISGTKSG